MQDHPTDGPDPNVRRDEGGWLSGPCLDAPVPPVPPGSTAARELLHAISAALALPHPAGERDERPYLILRSKRASLALEAIGRILRNREADDDDLLTEVAFLRGAAADLPPDTYAHSPLVL